MIERWNIYIPLINYSSSDSQFNIWITNAKSYFEKNLFNSSRHRLNLAKAAKFMNSCTCRFNFTRRRCKLFLVWIRNWSLKQYVVCLANHNYGKNVHSNITGALEIPETINWFSSDHEISIFKRRIFSQQFLTNNDKLNLRCSDIHICFVEFLKNFLKEKM